MSCKEKSHAYMQVYYQQNGTNGIVPIPFFEKFELADVDSGKRNYSIKVKCKRASI